jgi:hypothetical protein
MARRFYLPEFEPAKVSVAFDSAWNVTAAPAAARRMVAAATPKKVVNDALTTTGGYTSTNGQNRLHRQYVSDPMSSGLVFDTGTTYKCYVQTLEGGATQNIVSRLGVRIVSYDGSTVKATLLAVADYSTATEWNTSIRNKAFANGDAGTNASYTTVAGDRLVIEIGHNNAVSGTPSGSSRFGTISAGGDNGENETDTGATLAPWFETSVTVTFLELVNDEYEVSPDNTTLNPANTSMVNIAGTTVSDSGRAPALGSFSAMQVAAGASITNRYEHLAVAESWYRFYFQMDTLPSANVQLLLIRSGAGQAADVQIGTSGEVRLRNQAATLIDTSAGNLAVDVWHRLEFHLTTIRFEARIYSSPNEHSNVLVEGETTLGGTVSDTTWDNFSIGVGLATTWTIWLDALKVRTDNWVGSGAPFSLTPRFRNPMQPMLVR